MNFTTEIVIGYDCRNDSKPIWLIDRRIDYLLRPDVESLKSVDDRVWPSVIDGSDIWPFRFDCQFPSQCYDQGNTRIAITFVKSLGEGHSSADNELQDIEKFLTGLMELKPPDSKWKLLGYDIADYYFFSGLSNCGYTEQDKALLSGWQERINDHGLFSDLSDATIFQQITSLRVAEHAPFFIYGIYEM